MKGKVIFVALAALAVAAWSLAQPTGGYSAAPTNVDYRMKILEPKEGATITGTDISVVMGEPFVPSARGAGEKTQRDVLTPVYQFWVDGKNYGNLPGGSNVFTAHDISYGPHKIVVIAKNVAGEVVDRKELGVTTVAAVATGQTTTTEARTIATAPAPPAAEPPPAPPQPATAPPQPEPAPLPSTLPQTASSYPQAAAAGIALLGVGFLLRRRS